VPVWAALVVIVIGAGTAAEPVTAQVAGPTGPVAHGYQVIDLGLLPASPSNGVSGALGINSLHEIVGFASGSDGTNRAVVWLYCPNYGLTEFEFHDLTGMVGLDEYGDAIAINDSGLVVGRQLNGGTFPKARLWDLGTLPSLQSVQLATFSADANSQGIAYGVNNANPALVVGLAETNDTCVFVGAPDLVPFVHTDGDPPSAITALPVTPGSNHSAARGVNSASPALVVGFGMDQCQAVQCDSDWNAIGWSLAAPASAIPAPKPSPGGAVGLAVNDAGAIVGEVWGPVECTQQAAYWESISSSVAVLGAISGSPVHRSRARAVANPTATGEVIVVGDDLFSLRGVRWVRDSGGVWSTEDLNDLISPLCGWTIVEATGISDAGWIVGEAIAAAGRHAILLKPIECLGDLNGDCQVNGADLGILLTAWECPSPCAACQADLDRNGVIDGADLGILLQQWEADCVCFECPGAEAVAASAVAGDQDAYTDLLSIALALHGFETVAHFNAWRIEVDAAIVAVALESMLALLQSLHSERSE